MLYFFVFVDGWLMFKFRIQAQDGCALRGSNCACPCTLRSIWIQTYCTYINRFLLFIFLFFLLTLANFSTSYAFLSAYVFSMKVLWLLKEDHNGEQVEKHLPLWWGPWSGSRSARACVGCTVMSWQWSAETAAQPRPPRAQHRTSAQRPSASGTDRGEKQSIINMCSTQQIIAPKHHRSVHNQRNINIIS